MRPAGKPENTFATQRSYVCIVTLRSYVCSKKGIVWAFWQFQLSAEIAFAENKISPMKWRNAMSNATHLFFCFCQTFMLTHAGTIPFEK